MNTMGIKAVEDMIATEEATQKAAEVAEAAMTATTTKEAGEATKSAPLVNSSRTLTNP